MQSYMSESHDIRGQRIRTRSREEVEEIIDFWWNLQGWRRWWLEKYYREDSEAEILTEDEVADVRRAWEWYEMWYELTEEQKRKKHLAGIYNAALNNKSGWAPLANAIIKNKMPQLPDMESDWIYRTSATEHAEVIGDFIGKMATWLSVFAQSLAEYWRTTGYKKARQTSGLDPERNRNGQYRLALGTEDAVLEEYL